MSRDAPTDRRQTSVATSGAQSSVSVVDEQPELAYRDELTGLYNRRALNRLFRERWSELLAAHGETALLILDLDLFKDVNDTYGHLVGDEVLQRVADLLRNGFRATDLVVRYGGDEFVVALPGAGAAEARALAERTREQLAGEQFSGWSTANGGLAVSFSIGVASAPRDGSTGEEVLHAADRRLYDEKRQRQRLKSPATSRGRGVLFSGLLATLLLLVWLFSPRGPFLRSSPAADQAPPATEVQLVDREGEERLRRLQAEVERLKRELVEARQQGESGAGAGQRTAELEGRLRALAAREAALRATARSAGSASRGDTAVTPELPLAPSRVEAPVSLQQEPGGNPPVAARQEGAGSVAPAALFSPPELVAVERPAYPAAARRLRRTAIVELRVRIDETGRVVAADTLGEPAGLGFDRAAREAAMRAAYRPARRNGIAVPGEARLTVRFDLERKD